MKHYLFLACFFYTGFSLSNELISNKDSAIKEILLQLEDKSFRYDFDKQTPLIGELEKEISNTRDNKLALDSSFAVLKYIAFKEKDEKVFLSKLNRTLAFAKDLGEHEIYATSLVLSGIFYTENQDYVNEIASYKSAIEYASQYALDEVIMGATNNLANRYKDLELYQRAIKYYSIAFDVRPSQLVIRNLSDSYLMQGDIQNAKKVAEQLELCRVKNSSCSSFNNFLNELHYISIYLAEENLTEARNAIENALSFYNAEENSYLNYLNRPRGQYSFLIQQYDEAEIYFQKALQHGSFQNLSIKHDSMLMLAKTYFELGKYELSSNLFTEYSSLTNKLNKKRVESANLVLLAELELEQAEKEQGRLESELELTNQKLTYTKKIKQLEVLVGVHFATLCIVISILIYIKLRYQKKRNEVLENIANHDQLTNVKNRRKILSELDKCVETINDKPFSVAIIDIDHFKKINDTYGHQVGDNVLIEFTQIATSFLRKTDIFGRYGGEEFFVIFKDTTLDKASFIMQRFLDEMEKYIFESIGKLTFSAGISEYKQETIEQLIKKTDKKLYQAKSGGRNQIVF